MISRALVLCLAVEENRLASLARFREYSQTIQPTQCSLNSRERTDVDDSITRRIVSLFSSSMMDWSKGKDSQGSSRVLALLFFIVQMQSIDAEQVGSLSPS